MERKTNISLSGFSREAILGWVTEACDGKKQFFGQSRLMSALNDAASNEPDQLLLHVDERIKLFVGEAPQYDDITLFCLRYNGKC